MQRMGDSRLGLRSARGQGQTSSSSASHPAVSVPVRAPTAPTAPTAPSVTTLARSLWRSKHRSAWMVGAGLGVLCAIAAIVGDQPTSPRTHASTQPSLQDTPQDVQVSTFDVSPRRSPVILRATAAPFTPVVRAMPPATTPDGPRVLPAGAVGRAPVSRGASAVRSRRAGPGSPNVTKPVDAAPATNDAVATPADALLRQQLKAAL
jgi:hypothetical protein